MNFFVTGDTTTTTFDLTNKIESAVWAIRYRILTLDSAYQHHLNFFENFKVKDNSITVTSPTTLTITQNYTALANGKLFRTFSQIGAADYSLNKIIIFYSCI